MRSSRRQKGIEKWIEKGGREGDREEGCVRDFGSWGVFFLGRGSDFDESTSLDRSEPLDGCLMDEICCVCRKYAQEAIIEMMIFRCIHDL